ncbi:LysE family transporter [Acinetobacter sp. ANC 3791]|uniref:LysE family translocator n=1 Tax=Acinetobacter sp. ANC 3791 TaxID=2529836 RepID=UPI001BC8912A
MCPVLIVTSTDSWVKKAQYTILGGYLVFVLLIALCIFGIAAIIQASQLAFLGIKIFGGLYLIWLGIKTWRASPINVSVNNLTMASSPLILFRQGFITYCCYEP